MIANPTEAILEDVTLLEYTTVSCLQYTVYNIR